MSSKASGDAPLPEHRRLVQRNEDVHSWRMSYEAWQTFNDLREKGLFYDVELITEEQRFPAHKIVLCTCGHYFRSLFSGRWKSSDQKEIRIPGVSANMMDHVIRFAYTRKVQPKSVYEAKELLIVGSHFGVDEMMRNCANYLIKVLTSENCLELWEFSKTYYCKDLEAGAFSHILDNFQSIAGLPRDDNTKTLQRLDADDLCSILENDNLNVKNEKLPLRTVLSWGQSCSARRRKKEMYRLLSSVRLGLLSSQFLDTVKNHEFIKECPRARYLIEQQIALLKMKEALGDERSAFPAILANMDERYFRANTSFSLSSKEREVFRRTARPRFPREILLVIGGWSGNTPTSSTESFDPVTRSWNDSNITFPLLLKRPRAYHGVSYLRGALYVIGGFDGQTTYNSCDRYTLTSGKWKKLCGMYTRRCYVGVAELDGIIYAVGGSEGGGEHMRLKSTERFDPEVNVWTRLPDMTERRSDAGVCGHSKRVYVAGGFTGHQCVFSVEYFDVETRQWNRISPMRIPRSGVTIVAYKNRILALGGFDGNSSRLKSVEAFDPELSLWTTLPDMNTGRSNFGACVLGGKLIVMGGFNGTSTCNNVEYYDDENDEDNNADEGVLCAPRNGPNDSGASSSGAFEGNGSGDNDEDAIDGLRNIFGLSNQRRESLVYHREIPSGVWRRLPDMKISRSALSCCVVSGLPASFLRSIVAPIEFCSQHPMLGTSQQWNALDRLMAVCMQNALETEQQ